VGSTPRCRADGCEPGGRGAAGAPCARSGGPLPARGPRFSPVVAGANRAKEFGKRWTSVSPSRLFDHLPRMTPALGGAEIYGGDVNGMGHLGNLLEAGHNVKLAGIVFAGVEG